MGIGPIYILSDSSVRGAISLPLIKVHYLHVSISFEAYDYLVFTSKRGVRAADNIDESWRNVPSLAIGKATAKEIEKRGGKLLFTARSSYGDDFAKEIAQKCDKEAKILYLRPKKVVSSLVDILKKEGFSNVKEEVVYETLCNDEPSLPPPVQGAVLLFSSPSTIKCFFHRFAWDESYKAVAIGKKTASFFPGEIIVSPYTDLQKSVDWICENLSLEL